MQTAQWQAVYLHGKGGNAREAEHYRALLPGWRVTGLDYRAQTPWEAREEFLAYFKAARRDGTKVLVIANSIGAFFAMQALDGTEHLGLGLSLGMLVGMAIGACVEKPHP